MNDKLFGKLSNVDYSHQYGIMIWSGFDYVIVKFLGKAWEIQTCEKDSWPEVMHI